MVVIGGELFQMLEGGRECCRWGGDGETESVDCWGWVGVVFRVDADGIREGKRGKSFEVRDDEGGDVGEEDGVALEDLGDVNVHVCLELETTESILTAFKRSSH